MRTKTWTAADWVSDALREMRRRLHAQFGNNLVRTENKRTKYVNEDGDEINIMVLRAVTRDLPVATRADMAEKLLDYLADHNHADVRSDLTIEIS